MKTFIKRSALALMALLMLAMSVFVSTRKTEAATTYNNATDADLSASISSNGLLNVSLSVMGIKGITTRIETALYVEKRILGLFWKRVNIGCTDNVWYDSTTNIYYNSVFSHSLSSGGTYRITVTYTVSGSGGASDIITMTNTVTY